MVLSVLIPIFVMIYRENVQAVDFTFFRAKNSFILFNHPILCQLAVQQLKLCRQTSTCPSYKPYRTAIHHMFMYANLFCFFAPPYLFLGWLGSRWLACLTQARVQIAVATLSGNNLRQTVHTNCASVHQATKLVAALLRVAGAAGLAEVMGAYRQVYHSHHLQADCQEPGSAPEPYCL